MFSDVGSCKIANCLHNCYTLKISRVKSHDIFSCDEKSRNFSCEKRVSCDFTRENFLRVRKNYTIFHVNECMRKWSNFYRKFRFFPRPKGNFRKLFINRFFEFSLPDKLQTINNFQLLNFYRSIHHSTIRLIFSGLYHWK